MSPTRSMTILLAEDDEDDRTLICDALEEAKFLGSVRCVEHGEEVLDYLRRRGEYTPPNDGPRPVLILLDLNMPRKDGRETLAELKSDPELRSIPVVILTTSKDSTDVKVTYHLGANSYVTKPETYGSLVEVAQTLALYWLETVELPR